MDTMTELQYDILVGCLLGDGSLCVSKNGKNAYFTYSSSQKEHCTFVSQHFLNFAKDTVYQNGFVERHVYDNRTNKTYKNYSFRTRCLPVFTAVYNIWYKNKIKTVPNSIILNRTVCLYWYVGDGCLLKDSRNSTSADIKLSTYSFAKSECEFLSDQLSHFKARVMLNEKKMPYIRIRKSESKDFLNYIGDYFPKCYSHKWQYTEYSNKRPSFTSKETYLKILKKYKLGVSIYYLSKEFEVEINSIKHYIKTNSEYIPKETRKKISQFDLNDNLIKTWDSGQDIVRTLGFNAHAISACCNNKRKTHKNYKWQFAK